MFGKSNKKPSKSPWGDDHPERFNDGHDESIGFKQQLKGLISPDRMMSQLLGETRPESKPHEASGESAKRQISEITVFSRAHEREVRELHAETREIMKKLNEQIVILEKSEKNLVKEISKVKVEQLPAKTGIYYVRFIEWLLSVVKQLRMKIEQGRMWLETFNQRKKKKLGYWAKYKKHGTQFGLSQERTLATQTG